MDDRAAYEPTDAEIDAVLDEFGGDPRQAISALLHDLDRLARDYEADVSKGYVRMPPARFAGDR